MRTGTQALRRATHARALRLAAGQKLAWASSSASFSTSPRKSYSATQERTGGAHQPRWARLREGGVTNVCMPLAETSLTTTGGGVGGVDVLMAMHDIQYSHGSFTSASLQCLNGAIRRVFDGQAAVHKNDDTSCYNSINSYHPCVDYAIRLCRGFIYWTSQATKCCTFSGRDCAPSAADDCDPHNGRASTNEVHDGMCVIQVGCSLLTYS